MPRMQGHGVPMKTCEVCRVGQTYPADNPEKWYYKGYWIFMCELCLSKYYEEAYDEFLAQQEAIEYGLP